MSAPPSLPIENADNLDPHPDRSRVSVFSGVTPGGGGGYVASDDDSKEEEIDILDLKRNSAICDISLAQKDLEYIEEIRNNRASPALSHSDVRGSIPKVTPAPFVPPGGPLVTNPPFIPRAVGRGGDYQFRGGRGGRGMSWAQVAAEGASENEAFGHATNKCKANNPTDEEGWVKVGKGKEVAVEKTPSSPIKDVPSSSNLKVCEVIGKSPGCSELISDFCEKTAQVECNDIAEEKSVASDTDQAHLSGADLAPVASLQGVEESKLATLDHDSDSGCVEIFPLESFPPLPSALSPRAKEPPDGKSTSSKKKKKSEPNRELVSDLKGFMVNLDLTLQDISGAIVKHHFGASLVKMGIFLIKKLANGWKQAKVGPDFDWVFWGSMKAMLSEFWTKHRWRRKFGDGLYGLSCGSTSDLLAGGKKASGSHAPVSAWTLGNGVFVAGPMCKC
ncbi:hypothetical protein U1Q18_025627 [Sarracenia purpurea var. burkii]